MKPSRLDSLIAAVAPGYAARRQQARLQLAGLRRARAYYDGASRSHRTAGWRPIATDANAELRIAGARLRDVSREMCRNNPYAARAKNVIAANVVGSGIIPTIDAPNRNTKQRLEKLLRDYFDTTAVDLHGRMDLYGIQSLAMKTIVESGEVIIRKRPLPSGSGAVLPMQLQVMEPDYLDTLHDGPEPNGHVTIQGIEFDTMGRVVAYWLFNEHPGTSYPAAIESTRVPADLVCHVFRQDRPGQVRGASWFAPVIMRLRDFSDYADAQLMRQKIAACFAAFVTQDGMDTQSAEDSEATGSPLETFEPGMIERLRPGESVEFGAPPPVTEYPAYMAATLREIAAGMGISYEALTGDLTAVNFSSGRMGWLEFQRSVDEWRNHMLIQQMLAKIGDWFLEYAGAVNGSVRIKWTPPRREMISPRDEVPFMRDAIRSGLITRSEALRRMGYDPEVVDAELAEDNARADRLGLILDSDARKRSLQGMEPDPNAGNTDTDEGAETPRRDRQARLRAVK